MLYDIGTKPFNYNTLEPKFLKENGADKINMILGVENRRRIASFHARK